MDKSCKTPRWQNLKAQLNNLDPRLFMNKLKSSEDCVIIDVRTPEEFNTGHISKAINISYLSEDFWDRLKAFAPSKYFFVYCRSGRRSIRACTLMRNGGFDNTRIFNLDGGYSLFLEEIGGDIGFD